MKDDAVFGERERSGGRGGRGTGGTERKVIERAECESEQASEGKGTSQRDESERERE